MANDDSGFSPVGFWSLFDPIVFRKIWRDEKIDDTFFKTLAEFILEDKCNLWFYVHCFDILLKIHFFFAFRSKTLG
ncbi:MAG: hypothetical protein ABDH28_07520 [Brevinematia bacterium]